MIAAVIIGREGSVGLPGKNTLKILNRHIMEYPLLAARHSGVIDKLYVSTDGRNIMNIAARHGAEIIKRPDYLCTKDALVQDVFVHAYNHIAAREGALEFFIMLQCNAPIVLAQDIAEGVKVLRQNPEYDSCAATSEYNMFSPTRARRIDENGLLQPFIPFENYPPNLSITSDRGSQGNVYFVDGSLVVARPRCLENIDNGMLPYKWLGRKIYPLKQWCGLDLDYEWQVPIIEYWLCKNGFSDSATPYDVV